MNHLIVSWVVFVAFMVAAIINFVVMAMNARKSMNKAMASFSAGKMELPTSTGGFGIGFIRHIVLAGGAGISFIIAILMTILYVTGK